MTKRANLQITALTILIGFGATAVTAKGQDAFAKIDTNADGQITQAEFGGHVKAGFDLADANGDGALTPEEMMAQVMQRGGKRIRKMLEKFDADSNGALDAQELAKAAETRGGKRAARMMQRVDGNGDGRVTLAEMQAQRDFATIFAKLDTDGNGALSPEEFARGRHMKKRQRKAAVTD